MNRICHFVAALFLLLSRVALSQEETRLLLRVDDVGMCHTTNMAMQQLAETGLPFSASVMFACPWYLEAVEMLQTHPGISVGVHLTLNAEWKNYKWGPVSGREAVPSLVDRNGHFFASNAAFDAHVVSAADVEKELRAQVQRAMDSGLKIDYLDYHMLTPVSTPEYRAIVEKLAAEYNLGLSGYFGETFDMLFHVPIAGKKDTLLAALGSLQPDKVNVMVMHIGYENAEMNALLDMNSALMRGAANESLVGKHRHAELQALCAPEFREQIEKKKIKLVTYREIMSGRGLKAMKAPQ